MAKIPVLNQTVITSDKCVSQLKIFNEKYKKDTQICNTHTMQGSGKGQYSKLFYIDISYFESLLSGKKNRTELAFED